MRVRTTLAAAEAVARSLVDPACDRAAATMPARAYSAPVRRARSVAPTAHLALGQELDETRVQAEVLLELGRMHAGRDGAAARRYFEEAIALAD